MLGNLLAGACATVPLLAAGLAVALTWRPGREDDPQPLDHLLLALGWAFGVIPYIAFMYPLLLKRPLSATVVIVVALTVVAVAGGIWVRRGRVIPRQLYCGWRRAGPVLAACAGVGVLYVLRYDRSLFSDSTCLVRLVYDTLHLTHEPVDLMLSEQDDQRLGNTAVIAGFAALYGSLGFRLLFGLAAACTALGGFVLGRRTLGSDGWGWFVMVVIALNPYLLRLPLLDENLLALGFSSLVLPLLLRRRVPWVHVGLLLGLALMMRHALVLSLPAVAWLLWRQTRDRRRSLVQITAAFCGITWVAHVHHLLAYGSVFTFESYGQIPPVPHRFLGPYSGLLQWPFAEEIVRTPWNPLPTFLMWPVYLAGHFGLILFAAMILGVIALARSSQRRDVAVFWLLWFVPTYLALSLQEHWAVPNKMGVIYILLPPLAVWAGAGLQAVIRAPLRWGLPGLILALVCGGALLSLRGLDVPADARYLDIWEGGRPEDASYVEASRRHATRPTPWPQFGRAAVFSPLIDGRVLSVLAGDLRNPDPARKLAPYGWYPGDAVDPRGTPVRIHLDMTAPPHRSPLDSWITRAPGAEVDVDLVDDGPPQVITGIEVDWMDRPVTVLTSPGGADVTSLMLVFESLYSTDDTQRLLDHYDRALSLILGWEEDDFEDVVVVEHDRPGLGVRVLPGPLTATETINNAGHTFLIWRGMAGDDLTMSEPKLLFHN